MYRIVLFSIIAATFTVSVSAQKTVDFATIDAKMMLHYTSANWDSVIYYGKLGLKNNIDYFYLRKHLGEAYYNKQDYLRAIPHFEKAVKFNSLDTSIKEFLYYCYLYPGREDEARLLGYTHSKRANKVKNISLNSVYFETGPVLNSNIKKNDNEGKDNIIGNTDIAGNIYYTHCGLNFFLGKKVTVYTGLSYLNEERLTIMQLSQHRPGGRSMNVRDTVVIHPNPPHPQFTSYDTIYENRQIMKSIDTSLRFKYNLKQIEFYLKGNLHLIKGLDIVPFFHLLNVRTTLFKVGNNPINFYSHDTIITHTQKPNPPSSYIDTVTYQYPNHLTPLERYVFHPVDSSYYNYSFGLSVNKTWGKILTSVFAAFSNLNNKKQNQEGVSLTWYPRGNLNLYFSSKLTASREDKTNNIIFNQLGGFKVYKNTWLESFFTVGKLNDFTESDGFIVNNNPGTTIFRFGISPVFIFKHFDISVHYQYQSEEEKYGAKLSNSYIVQNYHYINHLIIGSIKWKLC